MGAVHGSKHPSVDQSNWPTLTITKQRDVLRAYESNGLVVDGHINYWQSGDLAEDGFQMNWKHDHGAIPHSMTYDGMIEWKGEQYLLTPTRGYMAIIRLATNEVCVKFRVSGVLNQKVKFYDSEAADEETFCGEATLRQGTPGDTNGRFQFEVATRPGVRQNVPASFFALGALYLSFHPG